MDMASMHIGPFRTWDFPILEEKGQYAYWYGPYAKWGVQYAYWTFMKSSMHIGHFSMSSLHTGLHEIQYANWMSSMHMGPVFKWGPTDMCNRREAEFSRKKETNHCLATLVEGRKRERQQTFQLRAACRWLP